jgi:hypothetical protein
MILRLKTFAQTTSLTMPETIAQSIAKLFIHFFYAISDIYYILLRHI